MRTIPHTAAAPGGERLREQLLFERFQRDGDLAARAELVERFLPLARKLARRYERASEPLDDLIQVASLGLLKAIDRFDPTRDAAFETYAHALMTGEVRRYIRDSRIVRIPRPIYEQVPAFQRALTQLRSKLGRDPSREIGRAHV